MKGGEGCVHEEESHLSCGVGKEMELVRALGGERAVSCGGSYLLHGD